MTRVVWDAIGSRIYEIGVDRCVLYPPDSSGVAWNGLTGVTHSPTEGAAVPYYVDGIKYQNIADVEEFAGTITAFTYPEEFEALDGKEQIYPGFSLSERRRKAFGLTYRTLIGNDVKRLQYGYKIHILYNVLASPSSKSYVTATQAPEAMELSWDFTTTPEDAGSDRLPTAHVILDSTKISSSIMAVIEDFLYGTEANPPALPSIEDLYDIFDPSNYTDTYELIEVSSTGLWTISFETGPDLSETDTPGLFDLPEDTRLVETGIDGLYELES
jgi:hypothetical protein